MSEKLKESLSAAVDGEADEFELLRVLDETGKDAELAMSWERYHIIGSVMRGERVSAGLSMREQVWLEVQPDADQSEIEVPLAAPIEAASKVHKSGLRRWRSLAAAAGVAVVIAIGFGEFNQSTELSVPDLAKRGASDTQPGVPVDALEQAAALHDEVTVVDRTRTDAYMIRHAQQRGMTQPGIGGFAKMVSYQRN